MEAAEGAGAALPARFGATERMDQITLTIAKELDRPAEQVQNVINLMDEGNTIPFIARYRKEAHGDMGDENLRKLEERLKYLRSLNERKGEVLRSIETQGKLTDELKAEIEKALTLAEVEDLYRPYKQKRRTRASIAKEKGLEPLKSVAARVAQEERERKGRDNQLRGRYDDIVFSTNMKPNHGGGYYKLIDGTRDMVARYLSYSTNDFIELSFARFTPVFDRARVWGTGLDSLQVEIRKGGAWQTLTPVSAKTEGTMRELVFDKVYTTVKMRFVIPGIRNQRNDREVYELELPSVKDAEKYLRRKTAAAVVDEGIVWKWDGSNAENATKWDSSKWYAGDIVAPYKNGGFTMKNGGTRYCNVSTNANWLVLDIDAFRDKPNPDYRAWHANILDVSYLAGTVTYPQAGLYTIELPPQAKADRHAFSVRLYGMEIDFNSIALMKSPANRVILRGEKGKKDIGPGDEIRIGVTFAEPCEDVAAQFLFTPSTGEMQPFAVNGTSAVELKTLDGGVGRRWGATVKVKSCRKFGGRGVYLKVTPLGSSLTRPIFGNFQIPFVEERE